MMTLTTLSMNRKLGNSVDAEIVDGEDGYDTGCRKPHY